jgi:hypothetical protein
MNEETLITMSSAVNGPSASGMVLAPLRMRAERRHRCRRSSSQRSCTTQETRKRR